MHVDAAALYELLPAHYRRRDAELGGPLEALFRILAREGAQVVDGDLDAFHDALFVETCAELLLPRIGALVGAERLRPLPPQAGVSMRAFIGNVLRYRRAKGTALALELLARDVTGYSAKAVEYFMRLSATQTVRAPRTERKATLTLRDPDVRARHGGAFDMNTRTPDMRSIARARGRYNIPNIGVHLWRLEAVPYAAPAGTSLTAAQLSGVPRALPWGGHAGHYALLPDGRATPLFQPASGAERVSSAQADVPDRLRRLPLSRELERWRREVAESRPPTQREWFTSQREPFTLFVRRTNEALFTRVPPQEICIGKLVPASAPSLPPWTRPSDPAIRAAVDPATGRMVIAAPAAGQNDVDEVRFAHAVGQPGPLGGGAYDRNDFESPFELRKHPDPSKTPLVYLVGSGPGQLADLPAALAAWTAAGAGRKGFIVVTENAADMPSGAQPELALEVPSDSDLTVVAAEWRTPSAATPDTLGYIIRRSRRLMLLRALRVKAPAGAGVKPGRLTLDGVYADKAVEVDAGALAALEIRHCTLAPLAPLSLALNGALSARVYRSITGRIQAATEVSALELKETIVARVATGTAADVDAAASAVKLERVTLFGTLRAKTLEASDSILMGRATAEQRQAGCIRYSYLGDVANPKLPHRYRCQPDLALQARAAELGRDLTGPENQALALRVRPAFVDVVPGEPAYALLAMDAPREIAFGAEGEGEMGAYGFLGGATRLANLVDLFLDYVPFGLEAAALRAERSGAEAARSNVP